MKHGNENYTSKELYVGHSKSNAIYSVFFVYFYLTEVMFLISESLIQSAFRKLNIN